MRDLVYYVATTLDGYIARADGSFAEFPWDDEYGAHLMDHLPETFPPRFRRDEGPNRRFDAVVMGRRTYEVGLQEGVTSPYPTLDQYVFSRTLRESPDPSVKLLSTSPVDHVRALKSREGRSIWLCGGSVLAGELFAAGLVDELILKVNPIVFGDGIPLFGRELTMGALALEASQTFNSGHILQTYRVLNRL